MKIIDPETGKRLDNKGPKLDPSLKKTDPLKLKAEKGMEGEEESSPMDPPDAYGGAVIEDVPYEAMHPMLQRYMDEHKAAVEMIERFDKAIGRFKEGQYRMDEEISADFHDFFEFFDDNLLDHNRREERQLFPLLHTKLVASGEHSTDKVPRTAIDLMEDDHVKFIQLGALCFNMLGLASHLHDTRSAAFVLDTACNTARELTELLRLHIHREDNILFPLAHKLINLEEFDRIAN
ncbi:MAG: hemerythrin domain-containing protein [Flavobacteriales bacterium]|jgi:iron-sulfur cluster repair protein YtfE (RIC family)|nr:hemerythrin domain-containing protein [Flavobacteriales bacterium]